MDAQENAKKTVLFVDDEENILSALRRELRSWSKERGIDVETANSGAEALAFLEKDGAAVKVVVSDLRMPVMRGSELLAIVKDKRPDIVTLLLSGYSELEEVMKSFKAGATSYMLKPWNEEYLKAELDKAFEAYRVREENRRYHLALEEELRWAGEMQRAMLKPAPLKSDGVEFRASYKPVQGLYCGGDYYDVIALGPSRFLLLLGDVAGHGVRGALVTGMLKAVIYPEYVRSVGGKTFSPGDFLSWLNERMNFELRKTSGIVIAFEALVLDAAEKKIRYANAGMPHPVLSGARKTDFLPVSGSAIGYASSVMYRDQTLDLEAGDVLLLYSDGLTEVAVGTGGAPGQIAPVDVAALASATPYGADYHKRIMDGALAKSGAAAFRDDLSLLTARLL